MTLDEFKSKDVNFDISSKKSENLYGMNIIEVKKKEVKVMFSTENRDDNHGFEVKVNTDPVK